MQVLTALLLVYLACVCSEESKAQSRIDDFLKPPHPQNNPPVGPIQDQSYFSRLTNWFFPGGPENKPSAQHSNHAPRPLPGPVHIQSGGPSGYLPPQTNDKKKDCNPCNKEPWIPVVSNYGSKTLIGFVPPSDLGNNGKPNTVYGAPPSNFQPPAVYGTPNITPSKPTGTYGSPLPPSTQYGPPAPPPTKYGPPSSINVPSRSPSIKVPSGSPSVNYGPPVPSNSYGSPSGSSSKFRPPPGHSNYGPPSSSPDKYGPPIQPPSKYGPPRPPSKYGPPLIPNRPSFGPHSSKYRPFHPTFSSLPPGKYGPPDVTNLQPPPTHESSVEKLPSTIKFESHISGPQASPSAFMGPPPLVPPIRPNKYGPPKIYGPPSHTADNNLEFIPPSLGPPSNYGGQDASHSSFAEAVIPTRNYGPKNNQYHTPNNPSLQKGSEFPKTNPIQFSTNEYLQPPPVSSIGPQTFSIPVSNNPGQKNIHLSQGKKNQPITNSYGTPILNPDQLKITSEEYLPPPDELPLSTGPDDARDTLNVLPISQQISSYQNGHLEPIPFPNMSPTFILPIHNARPFRGRENKFYTAPPVTDNVPLQGSNVEVQVGKSGGHIKNILQEDNVEVIKSVPVVDYLSTVEYPATVVQSPIIDLVVDDDKLNYPTESNEDNYKVNLSENPIIVDGEEHRQEASNTHTSVTTHNDTKIFSNNFQPNSNNIVNITPVHKLPNNENIIISPSIEQFINTTVTRTSVKIEPSVQTELDKENTFNNAFTNQLLNQNYNTPPKPFAPPDSNIINLHEQKPENKINQNARDTNNALFTPPTMDYSNWNPSVGQISTSLEQISTSMVPPPPQNTWISTQNFVPFTTKKPKQIQIIVPYTSNSQIKPLQGNDWRQKETNLHGRKVSSTTLPTKSPYNPPLSLFTKLPTSEESQWLKYIDHNFQESQTNLKSSQTISPLTNIKDFFQDSNVNVGNTQHLPFDILKLQKNIDVWTEQEYNKMKSSETGKSSTSSRFAYSKKIPDEYFTTQSLDVARKEVTTSSPYNVNTKLFHDYVASGTFLHAVGTGPHNLTELPNINSNLLETNLIGSDTTSTQKPEVTSRSPLTTPPEPQSSGKHNTTPPTWDKIQVSVSPLTNERVYVVTPQPWEREASTPYSAWTYVPKREIQEINKQLADNARFMFTSPRFSVRPEPAHQLNKSIESQNAKIHLVYSDWPELSKYL